MVHLSHRYMRLSQSRLVWRILFYRIWFWCRLHSRTSLSTMFSTFASIFDEYTSAGYRCRFQLNVNVWPLYHFCTLLLTDVTVGLARHHVLHVLHLGAKYDWLNSLAKLNWLAQLTDFEVPLCHATWSFLCLGMTLAKGHIEKLARITTSTLDTLGKAQTNHRSTGAVCRCQKVWAIKQTTTA